MPQLNRIGHRAPLNGIGHRAPLVLGVIALLTACGNGKEVPQASAPPVREIQLAPTGGAQPQLNDAPAKQANAEVAATPPRKQRQAPKPKPVAEAPTYTPPAPPSVVVTPITPTPAATAPGAGAPAPVTSVIGMVDAGRSFVVHPAVQVCTNTHHVGDLVSASIGETVVGSNGATIPAGSVVEMRVVESAKSIHGKDNVKLAFDAVSVRVADATYPVGGRVVATSPIQTVRVQSTADQAKKVGIGAAIGALAGQIFGKNTKSTVIGAAVGAGAGVAVAAGTADYDGCVPTTGALTVTLSQPLRIRVVAR